MSLSDITPADWGWARSLLRPYVLGGTTTQKGQVGRITGNSIPGETSARVLHFGAGTDLRLNQDFTFSMDFSEIQQGGDLGIERHHSYMLGLRYDF